LIGSVVAMPVAIAAAFLCASPVVVDGDGLRCSGERIRIAAIDAPEMPGSPKCKGARAASAWCDYAAAERAKQALEALVRSGPVVIQPTGIDRYSRTLARVTVNGKDAAEHLMGLGLARRWR
jgi:endonuclease YncB( thermonuclease family)